MKQLLSIYSLLVFVTVFGQTVPSIEASASKTSVEEGEVFTYQITADQDCPVSAPDFGEFEVVSGPMQGSSESTTIINGVTRHEKIFSYTYYLRAPGKGTYTIPSATITCKKKKTSYSEKLTIKVSAPGGGSTTKTNSNYYFKLSADHSSVYVGEPFIISFKFYSTKRPNNIEAIEPGNASGLWRKDLNPNRSNFMMTQETINGSRFYVLELYKEVCIPIRSGKIEIEPYYGSLIHSVDFFTNEREDGKSNNLIVEVKKLPENEPEDFNGLVGNFKVEQNVDKTSVKQGQSIEIKLTLKGSGNFNAFDEPRLNLPSEFSVLDPEAEDLTEVSTDGMRGSISYTFFITAEKPGDFELNPFSFSYYNLSERRYVRLSTDPITIHVEKGDEHHGEVIVSPKPVEFEHTDILYIHDEPGTTFSTQDFVFGTLPYLCLIILPPVLAFMVVLIRRKRKNLSPDEKLENAKKTARKSALNHLSQSRKLVQSGNEKEALKQVQNAFITYLMTKLNLPLSALSLKSIQTEMEKIPIEPTLLLETSSVWKKIEMSQYAPVNAENLNDLIRMTEKLILALDEKL